MDDEELDKGLYDMLLLGHYLLGEADPTKLTLPAYSVLGALWRSDCYRDYLNRKLTTRGGLRDRVQLGSYIAHVEQGTQANLETMMAEARKAPGGAHMVMLVRPRRGNDLLAYSKILGSGGYPLYLTPEGRRYAREQVRFPELTERVMIAGAARFMTLRPFERQGL